MKTIIRHLIVATAFMLTAVTAIAQPSVKGRVTDADGQPLEGVAVLVQGTANGTLTDGNGSYVISVKKGDVILFSSLGLGDQTFVADGSLKTLNVVMKEDASFIEETVVVGYGTQKKSSMTAAVSSIKGDELLKAPSTNVSQLLAGKLPGISSVQESGEPGLDQASLRIRGSIYGVSYVVDGFPVSNINDIDPADIESISVLKDASSAAVYGLQSSGGVIIVTTKKGDRGSTRINYNMSIGASFNANFPKFMDGPQFAYYYNVADMMDRLARGDISSPDQYVPYFTKEQVALMTNGDPTDGWDNVNYIDKVFGTGLTQKHNITVQGGNEKLRYFTSLGYLGQQGNIDNFNYRRYNMRMNVESHFAKHFTFNAGLSGVISDRQTPAYNSGGGDDSGYSETGWLSIGNQTIQMHPYLPERYDGMYTASIKKNTGLPQSPLAAIYESGYKKTKGMDVTANISLAMDIPGVDGLQLKVAGSYAYGVSWNKNLNTPYYVYSHTRDAATGEFVWNKVTDPRGDGSGNQLGEGSTFSQSLTGQASIGYVNSFGKNNIDLLALMEVRDSKGNGLSAYAKEIPFASLPELSNGTPEESPIGGWSAASRSAGYVFRARYNYDERYLAEFTGRYDGSYKFAGMRSNRWGFFPSGSIGWNMAKEKWMSGAHFLDDLKLRASVGLLGNDYVSEYMFLSTYSQWGNKVIYSSGSNNAYHSTAVPSPDLTWEKTLSYNVGMDVSMWRGKLTAELDVFYNYTYDMLTAQSSGFPSSMGGYYPDWINYNEIDARGVDFSITHKNSVMVAGRPFYYQIGASVTYSKTRWLKYKDDPNAPEIQKIVGTPVGSFLAWTADGLYRSEEEIDNSAWFGTRPCVGDIKYRDLNGDGKIDSQDKGLVGRPNRPQLTYGLNLAISWCGIDLNAQFTGGALFDVSLTGTYYNGYDDNTVWTQTFKEGANSPLYLVQNAYSEYNKNGTMPRLTLSNTGHGGDNGLASTFWLRNGRYIRLKSAQLGYTFPKKWMEKIGIESIRLFAEGQNLFTIDGLPEGIDPESPGVNNGYYPQQRLLMGGISLTF